MNGFVNKWRIYLLIGGAFLIACGLIGYGYFMGEHLYSVESPLLNTVGEIEFEAGRTRSWVDDVLAGVEKYEDDHIFDHLQESIEYLASLARSKKFPENVSSDNGRLDIFLQLEKLSSNLDAWKHILVKFKSRQGRTDHLADLQAETAGAFSDFSASLSEIKTIVNATVKDSILQFHVMQGALIGLVLLLTVAATLSVIRYERSRLNHVEQLETGRRELLNEIMQRKAAEKTLECHEKLFRNFFSQCPVALVVTRYSDSRVLDVNDAFVAVSGYAKAEVLGLTFQEIPIWENPADRELSLRRLSQERQLRDLEFRFRMKSGGIRTFLLSANIIEIDGEAHILASARDVTEVKRLDKALRDSEERLRAVVDNLPVGVWFSDELGKIVYGNPAARKIWSGTRYVGPGEFHEYKAWWADTGIALGNNDWAVTRAIRNGETSLNEVLNIECFDGMPKTILNSAVPMRDQKGQTIGVVVLNEDITDRKNSESKILWLASFPTLNPYPVLEVDLEGRVHYLNPATEKAFPGLSQKGKSHPWLSDWDSVTGPLRDGGDQTAVREVFFEGKWYHQSLTWVEAARRIRIYGLDITDRKNAEENLKTSHDALETWVNERTQQLRLSNQRLEKEVEERLRTEKSLIKHQMQLRQLSSALVQTEERERRRISNAIHDGIGQTLAAAKIKMGAVRASLPRGETAEQLDGIRDLISSAIQETRTLTFELSLPVLYEIGLEPALEWLAEQFMRKFGLQITVHGDGGDRCLEVPERVFLFQAIRELCFNVVKHARATQARISIQKERDTGGLLCDVVDNGIGFDPKKRSRTAESEMGFGLFSIREQLRQYGGSLTLDVKPGAGTRVVLRLPPKKGNASLIGAADEDSCASGG